MTGRVAFQKAQSGKGSLKEEYLSRDPNEVKEQSFSSSHNQNVCFKGRAQITTTNICTFLLFYVGVFLWCYLICINLKQALLLIATNKASGSDGIPVELFQILKDDAVKVLHSICQENLENSAVATGLEKVSFHSNPKERQCQRMLKLPHNWTHLTC